MKAIAVAAAVLLGLSGPARAQPQGANQEAAKPAGFSLTHIAAVPEPDAIPLYSQTMGSASTEQWDTIYLGFRVVRNVTQPTLTAFLPAQGNATGAAVVVVPGGGFTMLQMDLEGWSVAKWLAGHGVAAFVLKYRLRSTPVSDAETAAEIDREVSMQGSSEPPPPDPGMPLATADAIAALKSIRADAAKWGVDPARVGMIGFSAGAMTTLSAVLEASPSDEPNFFGYIYGPMDTFTGHAFSPKGAFSVPADAPPMFAALAMDDPAFGGKGFALVDSWKHAGRPVELHAYQAGGHAFGMGFPGTTSTMVMPEFYAWMQSNGMVPQAK